MSETSLQEMFDRMYIIQKQEECDRYRKALFDIHEAAQGVPYVNSPWLVEKISQAVFPKPEEVSNE